MSPLLDHYLMCTESMVQSAKFIQDCIECSFEVKMKKTGNVENLKETTQTIEWKQTQAIHGSSKKPKVTPTPDGSRSWSI